MKEKNESSLQNGKKIGNYVLTRNLGEGTFGKVKLGIHTPTEEKVAIKVLQKSKIIDVSDVQRVTRQIQILKQVRHPNLIQLYQIIQTPKQLFLVMEYVSQGELFEHIVKKKRLKEIEACQFFQQLLSGVQYLHELGIVHRDLKPENLLIDFNKTLKIVDFGLSNTYKPGSVLKTACGSPCYAAPQMIAGKKYLGLNADIWSCGVILFAMICGYLPFQDSNTPNLYKKIIAGQYVLPKFVSPLARDLIQRLLCTDPERRIKLKQIKNHQWFSSSELGLKNAIGIKIGQHNIPVDPGIIQEMQSYNENREEAKRYIQNNRHNHSITIYYLLLKRQLKKGDHSEYDICSNNFNPQYIQSSKTYGKEVSQSTNANDIQEIKLDRMATPLIGVSRPNRIVSRLSHIRPKQVRKHDQSPDIKYILANLPTVERGKGTSHQKRQIHSIILNNKQKAEEISLYDIEQTPFANKFHQTISSGWRKPAISFRTSVNKSHQKEQKKQERTTSERYRSVDADKEEKVSLMNRTFMGKIPKAYIPRWQNESERIRSILNTTISGEGKRKHKFNFYF